MAAISVSVPTERVGEAALVAEMPVLDTASSSVRFARNSAYVATSEALADGDELAVIPPVAGGSTEVGAEQSYRRIELTESPLEGALLADLRAVVATPADGAVAMIVAFLTVATPSL